jgi:hypothetical protein
MNFRCLINSAPRLPLYRVQINQPTLTSRTALAGAALFAMPLAFTPCHPHLGHFPATAIMQSAGAFGAHVMIAVAARAAALLLCLALLKLQGTGITGSRMVPVHPLPL